jgi:hypothetical protein
MSDLRDGLREDIERLERDMLRRARAEALKEAHAWLVANAASTDYSGGLIYEMFDDFARHFGLDPQGEPESR